MGCPNCNKKSVITLSICPSCGTMINDSVREELAAKITPLKPPLTPETNERKRGNKLVANLPNQIKLNPSPKPIDTKPKVTSELINKRDTNRTLVEFQTEKTEIPEWRIQMQNAVRQRIQQKGGRARVSSHGGRGVALAVSRKPAVRRATSAAVNMRESHQSAEESNDPITSALNRIKTSRKRYLISDKVTTDEIPKRQEDKQPHPFTIASRNENPQPSVESGKTSLNFPTAPTLIPSSDEKNASLYDTNELNPDFARAKTSTNFDEKALGLETQKTPKKIETASKPSVEIETEIEEIEDFAPFSLRFNSGLFDLIIGTFVSLIALSPFMLYGGNWFTMAGFLGFAAVLAVVMFIYMTTTIGYFGKTFGMHLFKIELIDIEGDEYPTFHQSAVSSAVYLISIAFGGIGFLTSLIDKENRAAHDLASGTIVVKEF